MSRKTFDVIVVGLGAMGSAACYQLSLRGVRVLGLEQFDVPNALGSSHGHTRMIRMAYYEHPDYVPLLARAYSLWEELESAGGERVLYVTGGLYLSPPGGGVVRGSAESAVRHGLAHERLDSGEIASRFPVFQVPEGWDGLFEPRAGFLLPERAIALYAGLAMRRGAELHGREPVVDWSAGPGGVSVRTPRGEYHAAELLFCGGAWTGSLVRDLGVSLVVTRQVMGWVWPPAPAPFALGKLPVWAIERSDGTLYYGFPMMPDVPGLKLAHHGPQSPADPDRVRRDPQPGDEETFRPALRQFLPAADGPLLAMRVCLYTNSPDHHFIVDRHPRLPHVTLACGFSGHGFKFASVIGQVLAELTLDGKTTLPAQFLGLSRFADTNG